MAGKRPQPVDKAIAGHFAEQRDFILETNATLRRELIAELDDGLTGVRSEMRLGFKAMDARFETRFDGLETRFDGLETRFDGLETRFGGLETRFDRLERKLDQLIAPSPPPPQSPS